MNFKSVDRALDRAGPVIAFATGLTLAVIGLGASLAWSQTALVPGLLDNQVGSPIICKLQGAHDLAAAWHRSEDAVGQYLTSELGQANCRMLQPARAWPIVVPVEGVYTDFEGDDFRIVQILPASPTSPAGYTICWPGINCNLGTGPSKSL